MFKVYLPEHDFISLEFVLKNYRRSQRQPRCCIKEETTMRNEQQWLPSAQDTTLSENNHKCEPQPWTTG